MLDDNTRYTRKIFWKCHSNRRGDCDETYKTASRVNEIIGPHVWALYGERLSRLTSAVEEMETQLRAGYTADEREVIEILRNSGSVACGIYSELRLNRPIIKYALKELSYNRFYQVTLVGIICASRFNFFGGNRKLPVKCAVSNQCQERDSFSYPLKCAKLQPT